MIENKIKSASRLKAVLKSLKKKGKKIIFTNGCFDVLHKGHVKLLEKARSLGDVLVVAINADSSVKKIKGLGRPVNSEKDRAFVLSALGSVDFVTFFKESNPAKIIKQLKPDVLVKGGDWKKEEIIGSDYVKSKGGKVYSLPLIKGYSTSRLIDSIAKLIPPPRDYK